MMPQSKFYASFSGAERHSLTSMIPKLHNECKILSPFVKVDLINLPVSLTQFDGFQAGVYGGHNPKYCMNGITLSGLASPTIKC